MTGISDQFVTIGNEAVAWGTAAATLTRGIEAKPGNNPQPDVEHRPSAGFRPGLLGDPTDTHVVDVRGGTYSLAFDLMSKAHGMALGSVGASIATTTPGGATNTRLHTITPSDSTVLSRSIHLGIAGLSGTTATIIHNELLGCKATQLNVSVPPKGNIAAKVDYRYKTLSLGASSVTPSYPTSPYVFRDTDVTTTLGGTEVCQRSIDLTIPTALNVTRNRICPGGQEEPLVQGRVRPTGTLEVDFLDNSHITDWLAGTSRALVIEVEGPVIEDALTTFVRFTFPAVKFTGDFANMSMDDLTGQPLPWQAFDNGTDPIWKIEYQTLDATA